MDDADFDQIVEDALNDLPDWAADALDNVVVLVEEEDADDPDLLGIYVGVPLTERGDEPPIGPARIIVYRRPLTEMSDSVAELREEIRITVLHEIGHHFGIDEERLDELGYG
ncbi:MAG: metallopeptidase family protein [Gaiellales bacterium]